MSRSGKHTFQHLLIEQEPRLELPFDADQMGFPRRHTSLFQFGADLLAVIVPAQWVADCGPGRSFIPEDENSLASLGQQVGGGGAALFDQAFLVSHRGWIELQVAAMLFIQKLNNPSTHDDFQPLSAAFNEQSDLGHRSSFVSRPIV